MPAVAIVEARETKSALRLYVIDLFPWTNWQQPETPCGLFYHLHSSVNPNPAGCRAHTTEHRQVLEHTFTSLATSGFMFTLHTGVLIPQGLSLYL